MEKPSNVSIQQITIGQYRTQGKDSMGFSVIGHGTDDKIYEWNRTKAKWVLYDAERFKKSNTKDDF